MSLLGRLEDLSLTDIVQIVFLSRRTGILEIIDAAGRYTVLFRHGLVVNASSPESPSLLTYLEQNELVPASSLPMLRQAEESGVATGRAALELHLLDEERLAEIIHQRVLAVVRPLVDSREGEFNFILSDSVGVPDIEYDPDAIFREGGIEPQRILGGAEGEKLKPLRGLEESMKAGKALLRGTKEPTAPPPPSRREAAPDPESPGGTPSQPALSLQDLASLAQSPAEAEGAVPAERGPFDLEPSEENEPFDLAGEEPAPADLESLVSSELSGALESAPEDEPELPREPAAIPSVPDVLQEAPVAPSDSRSLFRVASPEGAGDVARAVVLFERDPMVRVAARRAFTRRGVQIHQYGHPEEVHRTVLELFHENQFFVSFLELDVEAEDDPALNLMETIKKRNRRLPVVVIDRSGDLGRRSELLKKGADLYVTRPSPARLQPGRLEEELSMFAEELVLFAERAFSEWEHFSRSVDGEAEPGKQFYEMAEKERTERGFSLLKQLINELSNPNDLDQVSSTILRLAAEYVDRGVIFVATPGEFEGLSGFGATGAGEDVNQRAGAIRISGAEPSVLSHVATTRSIHRGKISRTSGNERLIRSLGPAQPTEVVVMPIVSRERVIGLFYGDNGEHHAPVDGLSGLEIFLSQAGYAFENALIANSKMSGRDWV
ncbi:MAG: DUF4388 domain-containing protein [Thermoanaerobaculia bacterium]